MIRILHTSDWHLGRFLYGKSLLEDQTFALARLLDLIDQRRPHGLLISGDIFDRSLPPEEAVTLLNQFLTELVQTRSLPVFLIPGNHDSAERLGFASQLLRDRNLTIYSRVEDAFRPVTLRGDDGSEALVYGIPFVDPVVIAHKLNRDDLRTHDEAVSALCGAILARETGRESSMPSVLLCHAFVMGGESSESEKEISIGGSSHVDANAFSGFTYTALGHLHKPQRAGADHIRYSGSLLAYSKSEVAHEKSVTEVRIAIDGSIDVQTHALPVLRKLRYIEGTLTQILQSGNTDPRKDDYILVGLQDSGAVFDAFSRIREFYPNLLHVARVTSDVPSILPAMTKPRPEEKSDLDLFAEFFLDATGEEMSGDERGILIESLNEIQTGRESR